MKYQEFINIDSEIRFGKPCIKGTRISVFDILGWLAQGLSIEEIIEEYPQLNRWQIQACLEYAADKERKIKIAI
ncbi:MAG: DUF433 domain-containing protein [Microscillaceae bacterium]|jgi:uncharacterized protein (DUF433 family)|nr:DUF433 domain-containing protein [Microscillaceae bacterium]